MLRHGTVSAVINPSTSRTFTSFRFMSKSAFHLMSRFTIWISSSNRCCTLSGVSDFDSSVVS